MLNWCEVLVKPELCFAQSTLIKLDSPQAAQINIYF